MDAVLITDSGAPCTFNHINLQKEVNSCQMTGDTLWQKSLANIDCHRMSLLWG